MEVGPESDRLLGECRAAVGLARPVRIAVHPAVASPAVVGGPSPVVLVPTDWVDWPEAHRRACLLHELAHLARYDDWARLAQELLRAPFFFHPSVRWLLARLDRERELLCDEAAVALGSDPLVYARLLLDLGRRPGRLLPVSPRSVMAGSRSSTAVPSRCASSDSWRTTCSAPLPLAPVRRPFPSLRQPRRGRGAGRRWAARPSGLRGPRRTRRLPAPAVAEQRTDEFRGVVLDPDGHPVSAATIVAGSHEAKGWSGHEVITTDAHGRFTLRVSPAAEWMEIFAYKDGFAVSGLLRDPRRSVDRNDLKISLGKPAPFSAVLVDNDGKPVAGAAVRVEMIAHPFEEGNRAGMSFTHLRREVIGGSAIEPIIVTATDPGGEFTFRAFAANLGLKLRITTAEGRGLRVRPRPEVVGRTRRMMEDSGFVSTPPGETARLVAIPAARVAGRVMTRLPGERVSGPDGQLPGQPSARALPANVQLRGGGPDRRRRPIHLRRPRRRDHQRRHPRRRREQGLDLPRGQGRQVDLGCDVRGHDRADPRRGGRGDGRRTGDKRARRGGPGRRVRAVRPRTSGMTIAASPMPGADTIIGCRPAKRTSTSWARRRVSTGSPARTPAAQ